MLKNANKNANTKSIRITKNKSCVIKDIQTDSSVTKDEIDIKRNSNSKIEKIRLK